jgi:hypothetical protein
VKRSAATTAMVDQGSAYVRDFCAENDIDLDDPKVMRVVVAFASNIQDAYGSGPRYGARERMLAVVGSWLEAMRSPKGTS